LIGGLSPESTVHYYPRICRRFNEQAAGLEFPEIILYSLNLQKLIDCFSRNDWPQVAVLLREAMAHLKGAGAGFVAILANTPHNAWHHLEDLTPLPVLTIMQATADELIARNMHRVALLGTRLTMKCGFFQRHFEQRGIETLTPCADDRKELDRIVWEELSHGKVTDASRERARAIIRSLEHDNIQSVVLGCTELSMLIQPEDSRCPQLDTMAVHAGAILARALSWTEPSVRIAR
jgi:aspartate racemase